MDEGAENLHNLEGGRAYYEIQVAFLPKDKARRLVHNRVGPIRAGTPVFPEFQDDHLYDAAGAIVTGNVRDCAPIDGLPLLIGADQGLLGAAVIGQIDPRTDQLMIFDELARIFETADGHIEVSQIGGEAFGREVRSRLAMRFPGFAVAGGWSDPAGEQGGNAISHRSWRKQFESGLGVRVRPSPVPRNAVEPRLKAVRDRIGARIPGKPRLVIHPRCTILRKAFNSKYVLQRVAAGSIDSGRFSDKPVKAQGYSDVIDALQYLTFAIDKGVALNDAEAGEERDARGRRRRARVDYGNDYFEGEVA